MVADRSLEMHAGEDGPELRRSAHTPEGTERLRREVRRLTVGAHPGVVALLRHDDHELVLAWAGDATLELVRPGVGASAAIAASIAATVADLHQAGIVHGRLDPSHVVIGTDGRPRLCGLRGADPDQPEPTPADDVAAIGHLLERLVRGESELEPIPDRRWGRRRWKGYERRALQTIADRATDPDPARRPTARELAAAITDAVPGAAFEPTGVVERDGGTEGPSRSSFIGPPPPEEPERAEPGPQPNPAAHGDEPPAASVFDHDLAVPAFEPQPTGAAFDATDADPARHTDDLLRAAEDAPPPPPRPVDDDPRSDTVMPPTSPTARAAHPLELPPGPFPAAVDETVGTTAGEIPPHEPLPRPDPRPATRPVRRVLIGVLAVAGTLLVALGSLRMTSAGPTPTPVADQPPASTTTTEADSAAVDGNIVMVGGLRYQVGEPGDRVSVADWNCDGSATVALVRPSTGEVFAFPEWADPDEVVSVEPVAVVADAVDLVPPVDPGCEVRVRQRDGGSVAVDLKGTT